MDTVAAQAPGRFSRPLSQATRTVSFGRRPMRFSVGDSELLEAFYVMALAEQHRKSNHTVGRWKRQARWQRGQDRACGCRATCRFVITLRRF